MNDRLRVGKIEIDKEGISIGGKRHISHAVPEKKPAKPGSAETTLENIPDRPLLYAAPVAVVIGVTLLLTAPSMFSAHWVGGILLTAAGMGAALLGGAKAVSKRLDAKRDAEKAAKKVEECKLAIKRLLKGEDGPRTRSWIADRVKRFDLETTTASLQALVAGKEIVEDVDLDTGNFTYAPAEDITEAMDHIPLSELEKRLQKGEGK